MGSNLTKTSPSDGAATLCRDTINYNPGPFNRKWYQVTPTAVRVRKVDDDADAAAGAIQAGVALNASQSHVNITEDQLHVMSYNILADAYSQFSVDEMFMRGTPDPHRRWATRWPKMQKYFQHEASRGTMPDLLCLQECDHYKEIATFLKNTSGHNGVFTPRTNRRPDGCATFWRSDRFEFVRREDVALNDARPGCGRHATDNVATIVHLTAKGSGPPRHVVLCNVHLFWNPNRADVKLSQAKFTLFRIQRFLHHYGLSARSNVTVLLCGDFNSLPGSAVLNALTPADAHLGEKGMKKDIFCDADIDEDRTPHASPFRSAYGVLQHPDTNVTSDFVGCLDYIFYVSSQLQLEKVLDVPVAAGPYPNASEPSDHVPVAAVFTFKDPAQ
eukprot:PhM_4_TR1422/c0_g1_i1/m.66688/K12603/CNOT6, CCR4; CCR4-NOT transcription complex subunit 6